MDAMATKGKTASRLTAVRKRWKWWLSLAILVAAAALISLGLSPMHGSDHAANAELVRVSRGEVLKTLLVDGSVESAQNIEIKCQVPGGTTLLWIVDDGAQVKQGDELVRLDSSLIDEQLAEQTILVEQAKAALIAAERSVSAAEIAVAEYRDGVYVQTRQELELAAVTAEHGLKQAEKTLEQARRLARRGFIDPVQLAGEQSAVEHAQLDLGIARRALQVLEDYTCPKMLEELKSLRDAAEATLHAAQAAFALEHDRLERLQTQSECCVIRAPHDGMVVHANDPNSSSETLQIELGARIRQRQTIIWLPDLAHMQVRALVHESQITALHPGLRSRIDVQGHQFTGEVTAIAHQPERTRRSQQHLKYYAATIRIDDDSRTLRPGQSAEAEILLAHHSNVLTVPVTAVVQQGDDIFAWVDAAASPERRRIVLGTVNETIAEVSAGLNEHDRVLSHPRADAAELVPLFEPRAHMDVLARFGVATSNEADDAAAVAGRCKRQPTSSAGGG